MGNDSEKSYTAYMAALQRAKDFSSFLVRNDILLFYKLT